MDFIYKGYVHSDLRNMIGISLRKFAKYWSRTVMEKLRFLIFRNMPFLDENFDNHSKVYFYHGTAFCQGAQPHMQLRLQIIYSQYLTKLSWKLRKLKNILKRRFLPVFQKISENSSALGRDLDKWFARQRIGQRTLIFANICRTASRRH